MKITIWNINGIRSPAKLPFLQSVVDLSSDVLCFGETKIGGTVYPVVPILETHYPYLYPGICTVRNGYSGTCIYSKTPGQRLSLSSFCSGSSLNNPQESERLANELEKEGRVVAVDFLTAVLIHAYTPNSGRKLARLEYRTQVWDPLFWDCMRQIRARLGKPVIVCGDLNIIPSDEFIWKPNKRAAGCTPEERASWRRELAASNMTLSYSAEQQKEKAVPWYSFWSEYGTCREDNKGWMLDHFVHTPDIQTVDYVVHSKIYGSDHCPITASFIPSL